MGTDIRIVLSLFTVLAPAGAIAFVALSVRILFRDRGREEISKLEHYLIVPLAVCMVGLIASATHLGSPSNALYVIAGWGRSPLSNEVVAAVGFLLLAGIYWLSSFHRPSWLPRRAVDVLLGLTMLAALWLVTMISVVYDIDTIPTWSNSLAPFEIWIVALAAGPPLALTAFALARVAASRIYHLVLLALSTLSFLGGIGLFTLQYLMLADITGSYGSAASLVPWYPWSIVTWSLLGAAGVILMGLPLLRHSGKRKQKKFSEERVIKGQRKSDEERSESLKELSKIRDRELKNSGNENALKQTSSDLVPLPHVLAGTLLLIVAGLAVRVPFYVMHLTVGL